MTIIQKISIFIKKNYNFIPLLDAKTFRIQKINPLVFISLIIFFSISFYISTKQADALSHVWVGVPKSEYGEQLWDRQSIKRNEDGSVRVLSKFIPKTKSEITKDILYTMDINCFEKLFRDVDVSTDIVNSNFNDLADWQDPNGDELILGVIGQVCRVEN